MQKEKNVGDRNLSRMIGILTGLLLLLMAISPPTHAQQVAGSAADKELTVTDLLKLPGKVLAKGKNTSPVGQFKLLNYRVEELLLPRSMKVELNGQQVGLTIRSSGMEWKMTGSPQSLRLRLTLRYCAMAPLSRSRMARRKRAARGYLKNLI